MKIGYLVPVSKTTNKNAATTEVSDGHSPASSGDTSATPVPKEKNTQKHASRTPTVQVTFETQNEFAKTYSTRTPSAQVAYAHKPEPPTEAGNITAVFNGDITTAQETTTNVCGHIRIFCRDGRTGCSANVRGAGVWPDETRVSETSPS